MTRTARTLLPLLLVALLGAAVARAGSIYGKSPVGRRGMFSDDKASSVGDLLTIVISEKTKIDEKASRDMSKSDARDAAITGGSKFDLLRGIDSATGKLFNLKHLDFETKADSKFAGSYKSGRETTIEDEITVVVEDVLPNGNLVILGKRTRQIDGETVVIQVSGIVRPRDISYANSIVSTRVGNYHLVHRRTGQSRDFTQPGWLARVLNFINPF